MGKVWVKHVNRGSSNQEKVGKNVGVGREITDGPGTLKRSTALAMR